ncbi:MAG: twin-arginine translocase subunit TatC [Planctomycetes bacterium]|jgi:Tat protein translocase TatC|nr:twin-arginine translocase subunit TatC [Planctomycetota bacterium]
MVQLDDPNFRRALDEPELPRMSFGDHLDELRSRLVKSLVAIVVAVLAMMPFKEGVQSIIIEPYRVQWRIGFLEHVANFEAQAAAAKVAGVPLDEDIERCLVFIHKHQDAILAGEKKLSHLFPWNTGYHMPYSLFATGGLDDMLAFMWAALVFAVVLASPVVIWQAWAFLAAGLYPHERKIFYRYFPFMVLLMATGVLFGYGVVLPYSLSFLVKLMDPTMVNAIFSVGQFLTLELALTGAMGLVFQLPLVMVALQRIGLVSHAAFVRNWRMTIMIIFLVAAIVTPPEPVSMILMATPMLLLFCLGLVLTRFGRRHEAKVVPA